MEQTKGNAAHDVTAQLSDTLLNDNLSVADIKDIFQNLHHKALSLGLTQQQICNLNYVTESTPHNWSCSRKLIFRLLSVLLLAVLVSSIVWALDWPISRTTVAMAVWRFRGFKAEEVQSESCLLPLSQSLQPLLRPPIDCEFCMDVNSIKKVTNISSIEFSEKYAHTGRPVVVKDAARNWSATQVFSFEFFKGLYGPFSPVRGSNCQFFPYKTEFRNLSHVFTMDEDRVRQKQGTKPWYIGWSNCDSSAANILRHHYERPYFLPPDSESSNTDWIFMGSPGYGAHMHIDDVNYPSWQAQITGHKLWTLQPPSECFFSCLTEMVVTVHPGEIIVLDTNRWYHSTLIVGADISITIGSEYD